MSKPNVKDNLSLFFISAAILSYEISLMRLLKIEGFGNFTYFAIGIALTGFGTSGTILLSFRKKILILLKKDDIHFFSNIGFILSISSSYFISQFIHFDPLHLLWDRKQLIYLSIRLLLYIIPFILGSLAIITSFLTDKSTVVYFYNMIGSGIGIILTVILFWYVDTKYILLIPYLFSLFALISLLLLTPNLLRILLLNIVVFLSLLTILKSNIYILPYKDIRKIFNFPDAKITLKKNSPYGTLTIVDSKMMRFAPGLSLKFRGKLPKQMAMFIDGDMYSTTDDTITSNYYNFQIQSLPYKIISNFTSLIYPIAGGQPIIRASIHGANKIFAICENPLILKYVKNILKKNLKQVDQNIKILRISPRRFLTIKNKKFDIIDISLSDTQPSLLGGLYSQDVNYLLTVKAFEEYIEHLKENGILSISVNLKYPPRDILKLTSTLIYAYKNINLKENRYQNVINVKTLKTASKHLFSKHIFIARGMDVAIIIFKKSILTSKDIFILKNECKKLAFDLVYYKGIKKDEINKYFIIKDNAYFNNINSLISDTVRFKNNYIFNISPPSDNNPYFYNFIKIKNIPYFFAKMGKKWLYFIESGNIINFITFIATSILSIILILLPVTFISEIKNRNTKLSIIFIYFSFIGIGYMIVEVVLIEMLKKFYDDPVISASIILASLLIFSGLGSFSLNRITERTNKVGIKNIILFPSLSTSIFLIFLLLFLSPIHNLTLALPNCIRIFISIMVISPVAFVMGMPFPIGIISLKKSPLKSTIWAWSINGYFSVITSVGLNIILPIYGFYLFMLIASFLYFLSAITGILLSKNILYVKN